MKAEMDFSEIGSAGGNYFSTGAPFKVTTSQSSYWGFGGLNNVLETVLRHDQWGRSGGNNQLASFNDGSTSGWWKFSFEESIFITKLVTYFGHYGSNRPYDQNFNVKVSNDFGETYKTLNNYVLDSSNYIPLTQPFSPNSPNIDIPINENITDIYLEFPTQGNMFIANGYGMCLYKAIICAKL